VKTFALLACAALAACGDLPEPFLGNPGATARRLSQPPPVIAVPPGQDTLLPDAASRDLAELIAAGLRAAEVTALARPPVRTDWRLVTSAVNEAGSVKPVFTILNPLGKTEGTADGEPVPLRAWAQASPALLEQVAAEAAPRISAALTAIRVARDKADPNSLYNRPARVMVASVTGAPGDGNTALTRQMRARLAERGPVVLTTPTGADFVVQGRVAVTPLPGRQEMVDIEWTVATAAGQERGKVAQLKEQPAGLLDGYWGDIAAVVASEAASGVESVILRQSGHDPNAPAEARPR